MKTILMLFTLLFSTASYAQYQQSYYNNYYSYSGVHFLELNQAAIDAYQNDAVHDPYLSPDDASLGAGAAFITNFDVIRYHGYGLYWDNILHFDQDANTGQIRTAGWQYSLNLVFWQGKTSRMELFKQHHSQHILERTRPEHFPVYDRTGIKFVLYDRAMK